MEKKVTKFLKKEDFFQEILRKSSILSCLIPRLFVLKLMTGLGIKEDVRKSLKKKEAKMGKKWPNSTVKTFFIIFLQKMFLQWNSTIYKKWFYLHCDFQKSQWR